MNNNKYQAIPNDIERSNNPNPNSPSPDSQVFSPINGHGTSTTDENNKVFPSNAHTSTAATKSLLSSVLTLLLVVCCCSLAILSIKENRNNVALKLQLSQASQLAPLSLIPTIATPLASPIESDDVVINYSPREYPPPAIMDSIYLHHHDSQDHSTYSYFAVSFIRHGEKPLDVRRSKYQHLSSTGIEHSKRYVNSFCDDLQRPCSFPAPKHLYAKTPEHPKYVYREIETITPLSLAIGVPIYEYGSNETHEMFMDVMTDGVEILNNMTADEYGITVPIVGLVCWEHKDYREVGGVFGCSLDDDDVDDPSKVYCPKQLVSWPALDFSSSALLFYRVDDNDKDNYATNRHHGRKRKLPELVKIAIYRDGMYVTNRDGNRAYQLDGDERLDMNPESVLP